MSRKPQGSQLPVSERQFSELVLAAHALATRPEKMRAFLKLCCDYVGARLSTLALIETRTERISHLEFYPEAPQIGREYEKEWASRDPMKAAMLRAEARRFYIRDNLIRPENQARIPFYAEWCESHRLDEVCIARIPIAPAFHCNWAFIRDRDQPRFSASEISFLELILPHFEASLLLHYRLDRLSLFAEIAREQFRHSGNGVVILSETGNVLFTDDVARGLITESGAFLMDKRRVLLRDPSAHRQFSELLSQCISVAGSNTMMAGGTVRVPLADDQFLLVGVMPFRAVSGPHTFLANGGRAVLTLFDPARFKLDIREELAEFYRLSAAEADVCWRIANGETLSGIAGRAGVTRETVRSQLKRIFAKTGVKRQPDLVRLVLQGPSSWARVLQQ